jgi:type II secretory pathway pseudopilin PulG
MRRRGVHLLEFLVALGLVGWAGLSLLPRLQASAQLLRTRAVVEDVASTLRAMHWYAAAHRQLVLLRIDRATGRLQSVARQEGPAARETVVRTVWLPGGMRIVSAPHHLTALPGGRMVPGALVLEATAYQRRFWISVDAAGVVRVHEESST